MLEKNKFVIYFNDMFYLVKEMFFKFVKFIFLMIEFV